MQPIPGQYERYRIALKGERLPLAFVDLDHFDRNVCYVAETQAATGKTIRVHTKSLRCVEMTRRVFEIGGAAYRGLMTFTVEETAHLAAQGFDDFIIAYPTVQASDLRILADLARGGKNARLMVDSNEHLDALSAAATAAGVTLRACVDIDMSYRPAGLTHLGTRRSPLRTADAAARLVEHARALPGVEIRAVMGYEAHIASLGDAVPGKTLRNAAARALKKRSIGELTPRRGGVVARMRAAGAAIDIVNGGGSGSLRSTGADPCVTEVTAGSAFYAPALFHHYQDVSFTPAAFFALQVVRTPAPSIVTCLGGGYVASGAAGPDKLPVPVYPEGLRLIALEGAGEVQTPLALPHGAPPLRPGDPVIFQHAKAGELAERFDELVLVRGETVIGRARTYRGEGRCFL
ncbi:MAG: alanine racemase [Deltaproteobacteria bacterium]|nr:alanine racemase [Deltaproteobacteria bacterium]